MKISKLSISKDKSFKCEVDTVRKSNEALSKMKSSKYETTTMSKTANMKPLLCRRNLQVKPLQC